MKSYIAFTKKEFYENLRSYKLLIMLSVFFLLGIMNPVTAKLTPQLLEKFMPEGIEIKLAEPTAIDSWMQFFKNVPQMGLIVLVIVFSGMLANEFNRGTLINILTKGLSRKVVIFSKFSMAALIWTVSYILCFTVSYGYTVYFWDAGDIIKILSSVFCLWLFGILLLSAEILGGVLFKNSYGCLMFTGGLVSVMFILNIIPKLHKYNPSWLVSNNMAIIKGELPLTDVLKPSVISGIFILLFIALAVGIFNKKEI